MYRNAQKRFNLPGLIYSVTTNTREWFPYFEEPALCRILLRQISISKSIHQFELYAFCILPDHIHLLIRPDDKSNLSKVMFSIKKQSSHQINRYLGYNKDTVVQTEGAQTKEDEPEGAQTKEDEPEGAQTFARLQSTYPKFACLQQKHSKSISFPKFHWHKSFYDHYIRDERDFWDHYKYVAFNHLKHGLAEQWNYTSLNHPELIDEYGSL